MERPASRVAREGRRQPTHELVLGDEANTTQRARNWVSERLAEAGLDELGDDAELVVSELVSNALLHAEPPVTLRLRVLAFRARVEVHDRSPSSPIRGRHGAEAMTGRGLRIVEGLARDWGVERLEVGKSIWAELEAGSSTADLEASGQSVEDLVQMWAAEDAAAASTGQNAQRVLVRLGAVPTDLLLAAKAHVDDLIREFALAAAGAQAGATTEIPQHLTQLLEAVVGRFAEPRRMIKRQALAAANAGQEYVTLEMSLTPDAADAAEEYLRALDEIDAYCRAARLLTLETAPRHRLFRRWYVEELVAQLRAAAAGRAEPEPQPFEQRLLDEIDTMAEAERAAERSARLNALAAALTGSATPEEVAEQALKAGVAAMGASGGGLMLAADHASWDLPGTLGYDDSVVSGLRAYGTDGELPSAYAARTGEAVWLESRQQRDERFPELAKLEPGTVSMCALPLVAGDQCLGTLRLSFSRARLFDEDERSFALSIAAQTAQALDRALLYQEQAETARRLQRTLLPPELPDVPGAQLASHYDSAAPLQVGGDFYDLIGAGNAWTVVMGDVRGKGVDAARLSAMARHTARSGALSGLSPAEILSLLNDAFLTDQSPETFCTAVCGRVSLDDDHAILELASGGHPEPAVARAAGDVAFIPSQGMLIGAFPDVEYDTVRTVLHPGDCVLFYTDGVSEARQDGAFFGRRGIEQQLAATAGAPADAVVRQLHAAVEAFQTAQRDDMALLAFRLLPDVPED